MNQTESKTHFEIKTEWPVEAFAERQEEISDQDYPRLDRRKGDRRVGPVCRRSASYSRGWAV